jgi:hypothetical protein
VLELAKVEGLGDEGEDPPVEGLGGGLRIAARADHHDGHRRVEPAKLLERLQPVHHRHVQVDEDQIGTALQHHHDAFSAVRSRLDLVGRPVVEAVEELRQHLPDGLLIVDDEDAFRGSVERLVWALICARHGNDLQ